VSVHDEVMKLLSSRGRIDDGVREEPEADIANLRAGVQELQATVLYLAGEIDRRDAAVNQPSPVAPASTHTRRISATNRLDSGNSADVAAG
jgi:hypothetical protein